MRRKTAHIHEALHMWEREYVGGAVLRKDGKRKWNTHIARLGSIQSLSDRDVAHYYEAILAQLYPAIYIDTDGTRMLRWPC